MKIFKMIKIIMIAYYLIEMALFVQDLPAKNGGRFIAMVNDEPITLDKFNQELASLPESERKNRQELLKRLINTKLIVQEAKRMGLDELKEIKNMVDVFSRVTLREELMDKVTRDVKVSEKEIEKIYKDSIREWKISSVIFQKEEHAKEMERGLLQGGNFDELSKRVIKEGKARAGDKGAYLREKDMYPQVIEVISKMKPGSISPVIPFKSEFVILRLEDVRYPENPEEKTRARQEVLKRKRLEVLKNFNNTLIKKYVKIHQEILEKLDYESKDAELDSFLKDKRVIAEIKGESPITVGDLTQYIRQQIYHGVDGKKLNAKKIPSFEEMLYKRAFRKEALRLGLHKTEEYKNKVKDYEDAVLFGAFVKKVIAPEIKLKEEELKSYYQEHIKEFTYPEMMRINSIVFKKREDAEASIEKLRKGTDFHWLSAHAEGQVDRNAQGVLNFDGRLLTTKELPEMLRKNLIGARPGDFRLYADTNGYFYVLAIKDVFPSKPQPYEEVKEMISRKIFDEKLKKSIEDYAERLRAVSDVKIYLKD